ncbi:HNH endonuclease [Anaeromyxobacter oryzae]|uniref:HNH nuclease domain-containing protein n=1 Tax=Anaeromyxobacter oryzae TaxID=2918170 RepID=A0ABM7WR67_9BACT|nr:HNH endonuclease signature motif containing protein [Anaeromyxobacter oryzae]BDG01956.1 hypothetical protein AMOR_09520 [Anaeromyxobacter oryzae]
MNARDSSALLSELLRREHHAMAEFLVALAAFDGKRLWLELGYPSLFTYLHRELRLSKSAAFYRKAAAELIQRFPEIVEPLELGRLCLSTVGELAQVLTPENRDEVIPRFFHLSKQEARAVVAELKPVERPPQREVVTTVRASAATAPPARAPEPAAASELCALVPACVVAPGSPAELLDAKVPARNVNAPSSRADQPTFEPLTADLRRIHLTVTKRFEAKVAAARDALSHTRPGASTEEVLEAALDLLLDRAAKRRGLVQKPRREKRPSKPDHIAAEVKREVWVRDGGCCQWALENGGICGSRHRLQYDHIHPKALGGPSTIENVRLLCRRHNLLSARRILGNAWMERFAPARKATAAGGRRREDTDGDHHGARTGAGSGGAYSEVLAASS